MKQNKLKDDSLDCVEPNSRCWYSFHPIAQTSIHFRSTFPPRSLRTSNNHTFACSLLSSACYRYLEQLMRRSFSYPHCIAHQPDESFCVCGVCVLVYIAQREKNNFQFSKKTHLIYSLLWNKKMLWYVEII